MAMTPCGCVRLINQRDKEQCKLQVQVPQQRAAIKNIMAQNNQWPFHNPSGNLHPLCYPQALFVTQMSTNQDMK